MHPQRPPSGTRLTAHSDPRHRRSALRRAAGAVLFAGAITLGAGSATALSIEPPRIGALPLEVDGVACGWLCVPDDRTTCGDGQPHLDGCPVLQRYFEAMPGGLAAALGWKDPDRGMASQPPQLHMD